MAASEGAHVCGLVLLARPPWTEYGTFVISPSRSSSRQQTNWSAVLSSPGAWYTDSDADCIELLSRLPAATGPGGLLIYNGVHTGISLLSCGGVPPPNAAALRVRLPTLVPLSPRVIRRLCFQPSR